MGVSFIVKVVGAETGVIQRLEIDHSRLCNISQWNHSDVSHHPYEYDFSTCPTARPAPPAWH
jgi:hypothetical protein